jgi:molybdopterin converting factor small subunit
MEIEVRLFAGLRKYKNEKNRIRLEEGTSVGGLLEKIGIPPAEVAIILVDGRHARRDRPLREGETVSLFPAIAGG